MPSRCRDVISDPDDERLADYVDLADPAARRRRERDELFIAEGLLAVARLLESPHRVRSILVTPKHLERVAALPGANGVPLLVADEEIVARTVGFHFHRGVVASAERLALPSVDDVIARSGRLAVLEGLNDPENLGLIARSARAFGFDGLLLDPTCIDPYYRRTVRVSMGEVLLLDVARFDIWPVGIDALHAAGFETWALTPSANAVSIWQLDVPARLAVVLGCEGSGLAPATLTAATRTVRIPIDSAVDSLNVGHAAAVAFAVAQRNRSERVHRTF
jgi:tRNA G18 (ribose-2'-O)-methylase SpoU